MFIQRKCACGALWIVAGYAIVGGSENPHIIGPEHTGLFV